MCLKYFEIIKVLKISSALPFGPYQKRMHSHVVPILFRNALPYGPVDILECNPQASNNSDEDKSELH